MKLTEKQTAAMLEAKQKGRIFQLPESRRFSPGTLSSLVKLGLLQKEPVGVVWSITELGKNAIDD